MPLSHTRARASALSQTRSLTRFAPFVSPFLPPSFSPFAHRITDVYAEIDKKFFQIPRSGTHMVMRSVMQDGIARFLDGLQTLREDRTPYGYRTLLKDARTCLERGGGVAALLPYLARYHVRCFGKLVNSRGDYT